MKGLNIISFAEDENKDPGMTIPLKPDDSGVSVGDIEASRRGNTSAGFARWGRECRQIGGPARRRPSRGRAFRTQSAVADIPTKAKRPLEGSGTELTLALSA